MYDGVNPMRAIDEINHVLEQDPDHLQANFNRGIMLAQIGRTDQALEQFERVLSLAEAGTPAYQRASEAIRSITGESRR
jgi:cytochrome c-type biogenesis protein CcmH/NrfG